MVQIKGQIEEDALAKSDDQDQQGRDFPPLRTEAPSPEETEAFRDRTFERYHEVLAELADS